MDTANDQQNSSLSDAEKQELLTLRAEKAAAEAHARELKEKKELLELRKEARIKELKEKNAQVMMPDDDLHMPLGQKIVLCVLAVFVVAVVLIMRLSA